MRVRSRKNRKKKNTAIILLFFLPIIGIGAYAGFLVSILDDIASFTLKLEPPNTDYFYPLENISMTTLHELAERFDYRLETYSMPANISIDYTFTDNTYSEIASWGGTDNGALRVGETLTGECLRYKWAKDNNQLDHLQNATRVIKKCVTAFNNMIAAPNGGLGRDPITGEFFPGTLSRFVAPPGYESVHPFMFEEHTRHFNGTGAYSNWRVRLYTSRDEVAGYYMGWASVLKYVTGQDADSKWCVESVKTQVEQVIEGFKRTNWLILGGDGYPTGSDLNPIFEGSTWQLTLLRIGATAWPEKYSSLYNYVAAKIGALDSATMGSLTNADEGYYAFAFGVHTMFSLCILEDNPLLQYHYIKNFANNLHKLIRYHRNGYYNTVYLALMSLLSENQKAQFENPEYTFENLKYDILDQLWRFWASGWNEGVRNYNLIDRPHSSRSTSLNPEIRQREIIPVKRDWRDFFENNMLGPLFSWVGDDLFNFDEELYMLPRTVSETRADHFFWGSNPFKEEGGNPTGNGLWEAPSNDFLLPYWMGKAFEIF
jgi:hypothetical protein